MSEEERAFIRAICEQPADDTPRLVFADWLEEHGEPERGWCGRCGSSGRVLLNPGPDGEWVACPICGGNGSFGNAVRAEFIRLQIGLARREHHTACLLTCEPPEFEVCPQRSERKRELELFTAGLCRWVHGQVVPNAAYRLEGQAGVDDVPTLYFSRGFVSELSLPAAAFTADLARAVCGSQPVTEVVLSDREPNEWSTEDGSGIYVWVCPTDNQQPIPSDLPRELFDQLEGGYLNRANWARRYDSRDAALLALSRAAVGWGRSLVKLLPLWGPGRG